MTPSTVPKKKKFVALETRIAAQHMIEDPAYREKLLADLRARRLRPAVEVMLWAYALGKPKEMIEHSGHLQLQEELSQLTDEELRQRALQLAATLKRSVH